MKVNNYILMSTKVVIFLFYLLFWWYYFYHCRNIFCLYGMLKFVNKRSVFTRFIVALPVSIPAPFVPSADHTEDHVLWHPRRAPCIFYHTYLLLGGLNKTDQVNEDVMFWIFIHSLTALNLEGVSVTFRESLYHVHTHLSHY